MVILVHLNQKPTVNYLFPLSGARQVKQVVIENPVINSSFKEPNRDLYFTKRGFL